MNMQYAALAEALERGRQRGQLVWLMMQAPWNEAAREYEQRLWSEGRIQELKKYFVFVSLDAALYPGLDAGVQWVLSHLTGRDGWPASLFLEPQTGRAVMGAPALEPEDFADFLFQLAQAWALDSAALVRSAEENGAQVSAQDPLKIWGNSQMRQQDWNEALAAVLTPLEQSLDVETGFVGNSEHLFQYPAVYSCLARVSETARWAQLALNRLAQSHLYDPLEGGFFRAANRDPEKPVSTEKLATENAEFLEALSLYADPERAEYSVQLATEVAHFLFEDLCLSKTPAAGWSQAVAQSGCLADYHLDPADLLRALPGPLRQGAQMFFGVESRGQVPFLPTEIPLLATYLGKGAVDLSHELQKSRELLKAYRRQRRQHVSLGAESVVAEALSIRALVKAQQRIPALREIFHRFQGFSLWAERLSRLLPVLETTREQWAVADALTLLAGEAMSGGARVLALNCLTAVDEWSDHKGETFHSLHIEFPFSGRRWDVMDHLGPSAAALKLRYELDRWALAHQEGDVSRERSLRGQAQETMALVLPVAKKLGLRAASFYATCMEAPWFWDQSRRASLAQPSEFRPSPQP